MKNSEISNICTAFGIVTLNAAMLVLAAIAGSFLIDQTHKGAAQAYDLNCLTEPREKPLTECKK